MPDHDKSRALAAEGATPVTRIAQYAGRSQWIAAIEENAFQLSRLLAGSWPRAELHDDPEMLWTVTDIAHPMFNAVLRANLPPAGADTAIESVKARCAERGVPLAWSVGPTTRPADLGAHLVRHGFVHAGDSPGMAADLDAIDLNRAVLAGLSIERVSDEDRIGPWADAVASVFGIPDFARQAMLEAILHLGFDQDVPMFYYLGRWHGRPVAASSVLLAAGVAGLYNVGTAPEARGQGIGAAMTLAALVDARTKGYHVAVLQSSPMGYELYRALGFQQLCHIGRYFWMVPGEG